MSNWTFHRATLHEPGGRITYFDTYPVGRINPRERFSCKYCYMTHRDWYQMEEEGSDVILCGKCGYNSLKEHAGPVR